MFRKLISFNEAKKTISIKLKPPSLVTEKLALLDAHNRVLAEDIVSALDIPPFDRSTVDGYAVKAVDTFGANESTPQEMTVKGTVHIGEPTNMSIGMGEAAEIVTGAPIPNGADSVVMVEDTHQVDSNLRIYRAVTPNENILKKGTDIKKASAVLKKAQVLGSKEIGVLAALGKAQIEVYTVPTVAVLSTGAEVIEPGKELPAGKIYDINAYSLTAAVRESGGKPIHLGVVPDEGTKLRAALEHALVSANMVITSGGVSVGPKDLIPGTVSALGKPGLIFCGVAVKPGKPTTVAKIGEKPIFALPGHPTSALLLFHLLVRPVIQAWAGRPVREIVKVKALAGARMFSARGRRTFVMVRLKKDSSKNLLAEPVETGASGAITTLAKADGFIEIPENQQFIDADEETTVTLLKAENLN